MYLRIKTKRGRIIGEEALKDFEESILNCLNATYSFFCRRDPLLKERYFIDFRAIRINSGHHFHFICLCKDKYANDTYSFKYDRYNVAYFCDHTSVQFCPKFERGDYFEVRFPKYTVIRPHHKKFCFLAPIVIC